MEEVKGEAPAAVADKPKEPEKVALHSVNLEQFEELVYQRQHVRGMNELVAILLKLRAGAGFMNHPVMQMEDPKIASVLCTRLAAAITALLVDVGTTIDEDEFSRVAVLQPTLDTVFSLSAFQNSDHIMALLSDNPSERDPAKRHYSSQQAFAKAMMVWTMDSNIDIDFEGAFANAKTLLFSWFLGMSSRLPPLTARAFDRYQKIIGYGEAFEQEHMRGDLLPALADANMHCSYAVRPDKHKLKRSASRILKKNWASLIGAGVGDARDIRREARRPLGGQGSEKPVILMPIEWWTSHHAMYRCYEPVVAQLRKDFRLVAMARPDAYDEESAKCFDEVIPLGSKTRAMVLQEIVMNIKRIKPDVIYYLSVGMAQWWTALSAVRLAPIQLMSLGHPASSMSVEMDYALVEHGLALGPDTFRETILELPVNALKFKKRADHDEETIKKLREGRLADNGVARAQGQFHVAVPAMAAKLNYPFIKLLQEARNEAALEGVTIHYHFFPNLLGMGQMLYKRLLTELLPGSIINERCGYDLYLLKLSTCDVHASPFPFGGTNSNLDSMQLGMPVLALEGPMEVHERYDAAMLRRAGLADLIAGDADHYKSLLVKMATDAKFLDEQKQKAMAPDIDAIFYSDLAPPAKDAFANAIKYVYRNHSRLKTAGRKIRWEEYSNAI